MSVRASLLISVATVAALFAGAEAAPAATQIDYAVAAALAPEGRPVVETDGYRFYVKAIRLSRQQDGALWVAGELVPQRDLQVSKPLFFTFSMDAAGRLAAVRDTIGRGGFSGTRLGFDKALLMGQDPKLTEAMLDIWGSQLQRQLPPGWERAARKTILGIAASLASGEATSRIATDLR